MQTVRVYNVTKGLVLAQTAQLAVSLRQRLTGLLGKAGLQAEEAMVLKPCSSIHTFFMRFPIDVLFLDKQMRIIKVIPNLSPYRLSPIIWSSRMAIELPAEKINSSNAQIGDIITLQG